MNGQCDPAYLIQAGGSYDSDNGVSGVPSRADGEADGSFTGQISGSDYLVLTYPDAEVGTQICVTVGYQKSNGVARIELNGTDLISLTLLEIRITEHKKFVWM